MCGILIQKTNAIIFHIRCSSLSMLFFVFYNMLHKIFFILCFYFFLSYELMFCFVILGTLNLTLFVKYYCNQKSKLKLKMCFAMFHNEHWYKTVAHVFTPQFSLSYTFIPVLCLVRSNLEPVILEKI